MSEALVKILRERAAISAAFDRHVLARHMVEAADEIERLTAEPALIVKWMRAQAATWERLSRKSAARGPEYADITNSQAGIAASYTDHADAIERGDYRQGLAE